MSPAQGIEQLEKRFQADPTSKAFLPLAEAHRKAGQHDRAIEILKAGLEHNTNYTAAQVALARALLAVNQSDEARVILARVVTEVPDNLLAARLLDISGGPLQGGSEVSAVESAPEESRPDPSADGEPGTRDAGSTQVFEEAFADDGPVASSGAGTSIAGSPESVEPDSQEDSPLAAGLGPDPNATRILRLDDAVDPDSTSGQAGQSEQQSDVEDPGEPTSRANRDDLQDDTAEELGAGAEGVDASDMTFRAGSTDDSPAADLLGDAEEADEGPDDGPALISGVDEPVWALESDADTLREPEPDVPVDSWKPDPDAADADEIEAVRDEDDSSFAPYDTLRLSREEAARYVEAGTVPAAGADPAEDVGDEERGSQGEDSEEPSPADAGTRELDSLNLTGFEEPPVEPELADEPDEPENATCASGEGLPLATAENEPELADEPDEPENATCASGEGLPLATAESEPELADEPEESATDFDDKAPAGVRPAADEMSAGGDDDLFAVEQVSEGVDAPEVISDAHSPTDGLLAAGEATDEPDRMGDGLPDAEAAQTADEAPGAEPVDESLADEYERAVEETLGGEPLPDSETVLIADSLPPDGPVSTLNGQSIPELQDTSRLLTLARLYRRKGEPDRAAGIYRDLLEGDPSHDEARRELAELCGEGLSEITSEDIVDHVPAHSGPFPRACAESLSDVRRRRIDFLKSWLDHIRAEG